jgi:putative SOS response-associated peptidase YedK
VCGRFVIAKTSDFITELFEIDELETDLDFRSYNVPPTTQIPMIVEREIDGMPSRQLHAARWGLIPSWAKEVSSTPLINARIESVLDKPSFQEAAFSKRCAIPADGYFEWQSTIADSKVPFFIHPSDGMLAFAGIYSWWRNPAKAANDPTRWVLTCSLLTKDSAPELSHIHNRNPVMLSEENLSAWLAPDYQTTAEVLAALSDESDEVAAALEFYPVSAAVGSVHNNSAELIARVN